jgi:hypothetical protein
MHKPSLILGAATALLLQGCQTPPPAPPVVREVVKQEAPNWRGEALPEDIGRIESVAAAWHSALDRARHAGFRRQIQAERKLLDDQVALPFPAPSPGSYMCRTIRFSAPGARTRAFLGFKPFFCYVGADGDKLYLAKQTGSDRPSGYLWKADNDTSLIFLGSISRGETEPPIPYGSDRARDLAGLFQRIGPLRFRLVLPREHGALDILELVPAAVQNDE